jgi:hypothetical protein
MLPSRFAVDIFNAGLGVLQACLLQERRAALVAAVVHLAVNHQRQALFEAQTCTGCAAELLLDGAGHAHELEVPQLREGVIHHHGGIPSVRVQWK